MFQRGSARVQSTRDLQFPAPVKGWVKSGNITTAGRDQAEVLDNIFPTAQSGRLRGGSTVYANIGAAIVQLFTYSSGADRLFATTAGGIYDATRVSIGGAVFPDVAGLGSGDFSTTQISTAGGEFIVSVNGTDPMHYFNGAIWNPVNGVAVNNVGFDAMTLAFAVGQTITGGTSGATAVIVSITQTTATAGVLKVGAITGGPFQNNEALTSASGAATADGASSAAAVVTLTGVSTSALAHVWLFKERLFFVEKNSQSAWYLPVKQIGGVASEINLGSVFRKGGNLLFGATWSLDTGSGIDDICLFVSTNGEIVVYEGTDPSTAGTWALKGVYEISPPLNKHGSFKAGGDLAILTNDGIIPVSEALRKDRAALQAIAITYPIEDAWKAAIANRNTAFPIIATLWQSQAALVIGVPGAGGVAFVANARTGAWCRYTGWDVRCGSVAEDQLYFGTSNGRVMSAETGGSDNGVQYTGFYVPKFTDAGAPGVKVANEAGVTIRTNCTPTIKIVGMADYQVSAVSAPVPVSFTSGNVWGTGVWGAFVWGGVDQTKTYTLWETINDASGYSIAPALLVTANQTVKPLFEILATRIRYEAARTL